MTAGAISFGGWRLSPAWSPWIVFAGTMIAIALVFYFYKAQKHAACARLLRVLTALRVGLILLLALVLLAPSRALRYDTHSRGTLWLLIDDSASMRQVDRRAPAGELREWAGALGSSVEKIAGLNRGQLAAAALTATASPGRFAPSAVIEQYDVKIIPISKPRVIVPLRNHAVADAVAMLRDPAGGSTAIGDALRLVCSETKDNATVLIISDGRQNRGADPLEEARRLAERGIHVFTLAAGSPEPVRDAAVDSIGAPDSVFAGDEVVLTASIRLDGIGPDEKATIALRRDGRVLQQKILGTTHSRLSVEFTDKPDGPGTCEYEIAVAPIPREATTENNQRIARITVTRDKLKVLLVDDQPRWEYQFLRNDLIRDHRFELVPVLLQPARVENIRSPAGPRLPTTPEGWSHWDVVILGDVPPERLPPVQQALLASALRDGKIKGLVLIAGPQNMPDRFAAAPLAEMVPVELSGHEWDAEQLAAQLRRGFVAQPAADSPLARFAADDDANRELWAAMPPWFWHEAQTTARPGATVAWSIDDPPAFRSAGAAAPSRNRALLAAMRYGAGRVLYLASPETWRLRYAQRSDAQVVDLHRRFWGQAIRWLDGGTEREDTTQSESAENRNLSADPRLLAAIAKAGNGIALSGPDVLALDSKLPRSNRVQSIALRVGLFAEPTNWQSQLSHWGALAAFLAMITSEWVLRKRGGLV
ncbi:MAG TPA: vWA domain-containing protein [Tepidisphaeraceae bacterium]|nr:vWA domain-containing protein [Tepidisphaeraceae bacterium]